MAQLINGAAQDVWEPSEHDEDTPNTEKSGLTRYKRPGVSLEFLVAQYLDTQILKAQQTSNWNAEKLSDEQIKYAALDAVVTVLLAFKLLPILNAEKMMEVYKLQCLSLIAICEMEYLGVKVDWDQHSRLVRSWEEGLHQAEVQTNLFFGDINKGSPKQLGEWLTTSKPELVDIWPRTEKGAITFTVTALSDFRHLPEIKALFNWKKYQKLLTTYGASFADGHKNPVTNRVHTQFTVGQTATGRMSSGKPNMQQIPSKGVVG